MPLLQTSPTSISGLHVIQRQKLGDERGYLSRVFCEQELEPLGWGGNISQVNYTKTQSKGTVRGMHYQLPPHEEIKIVSCMKGKIFDVALDLRQNSPTYLKWEGRILSEENMQSYFIPKGVAHGFQTLSDNCEILYLHDEPYRPESESAVNALDPAFNIDWPTNITLLSERDKNHPFLGKI
ncbi:MAG: dTDP-4-dehydrorhamnose 3,5-epimerase [Nitratireductor sp.]